MTEDKPDLQRRELIIELIALTQKLERPPSEEELNKFGEFRYRHYEEEFGDLYTALDESGILPDSVTREQFDQSQLSDRDSSASTMSEADSEDSKASADGATATNEPGVSDQQNQTSDLNEPVESGGTADEDPSVLASESPPSDEFADLTSFQRDILIVLAGTNQCKGLKIKEELESYYEEEIHHGRLYPNLDALVDQGIIKKISLDGRSNGYSLSERGKAHIDARRHWESELLNWLSTPSKKALSTQREDTISSQQAHSDQATHENGGDSSTSISDAAGEERNATEEMDSTDEPDKLLNEIMREFEGLDESLSDPE